MALAAEEMPDAMRTSVDSNEGSVETVTPGAGENAAAAVIGVAIVEARCQVAPQVVIGV